MAWKFSLSPKYQFLAHCEFAGFAKDPVQLMAIEALDELYQQLLEQQQQSWFSQLTSAFIKKESPKGIYLWGGVGRGKTLMMDLFFQSLENKLPIQRLHFHRFMYWVHQQLIAHKGQQNPLTWIAKELASQTKVLCFDEFFVSEIGDAMILGRLFETLFAKGVVLVATSNIPPSKLYWKGLHRSRFIPTIQLIEQNTQIIEVDNGKDYRLRTLIQMHVYHQPLGSESQLSMQQCFDKLSGGEKLPSQHILIQGREIKVIAHSSKILWCSFNSLCEGERATIDYIEISKIYPTILVSEIPTLQDLDASAVRRFIALVDELYEHNIKLIISAEKPAENLYQGEQLAFEYQRTLSRLTEMQSSTYLSQQHIA
ncbi:MAG: cell division protein ZapE [Gammaproteobacteria bacterium CG22_combo_CG10-13_8_21_14_all_40_8]|nr:MAG: cell division protein ZapE [Gammaproteobacteria bacterium CG22_combo_CG10-13_8_21_14_all_40_8]